MNVLPDMIAQNQSPGPQPGGMSFLLPAMLLALLVFMFLSSRSQKKRGQNNGVPHPFARQHDNAPIGRV